MTTYGSADVGFLLADGYTLLGDSTKLNDHKEALMEDAGVLGEAWPGFKALGVTKYNLSQKGFYDDAVDQTHAALVGMAGADRVLVLGYAGNVQSRPFVGAAGALNISYDRQIVRLALTKAEAEYLADGFVEEGIIQEALAARDTTPAEGASIDGGFQAAAVTITSSSVANPTVITTATVHNLITGDVVLIADHSGSTPDINGPHVATVLTPTTFTIPVNVTVGGTGGTSTRISNRGGAGYLEWTALALGGYTDVTVKIRDSSDDIAYSDLITFTNASGTRGAERKTVAGTVDRYTQAVWTFNGSGSSESITFMLGLVRN